MTLKRYPHRGPYWYAVFSLRRPGETGRGKLKSLSTGETDKHKAEPAAAFLFMQSLAKYLGYDLVPTANAVQVPGWEAPTVMAVQAGPTPMPKIVPLSSALDPEIAMNRCS